MERQFHVKRLVAVASAVVSAHQLGVIAQNDAAALLRGCWEQSVSLGATDAGMAPLIRLLSRSNDLVATRKGRRLLAEGLHGLWPGWHHEQGVGCFRDTV